MLEQDYRALLLIEMSKPRIASLVSVWKQNNGLIKFNDKGKERAFHAGPPTGAGDISGIVKGHGWRVEIEVKAFQASGRLYTRKKPQEQWAKHIEDCGGVYVLMTEKMGLARCTEALEEAIERRKLRP